MKKMGCIALCMTLFLLSSYGKAYDSTMDDLLELASVKEISNEMIPASIKDLGYYVIDQVISFFSVMNEYGWKGDIVVFSSNLRDCNNSSGYDICSDSLHYSPLGDGFLCSYDDGNRFHRSIGKTKQDFYLKHLNEYGLFSQTDIAQSFARDCTNASKQYDHAIETESSWYPIAIGIVKTYL